MKLLAELCMEFLNDHEDTIDSSDFVNGVCGELEKLTREQLRVVAQCIVGWGCP